MNPNTVTISIFIVFLVSYPIFAWADFKDDFNDGVSPLWDPVKGIWEPLDGTYRGKDPGLAGVYSLLLFETADGITIKVRAARSLVTSATASVRFF